MRFFCFVLEVHGAAVLVCVQYLQLLSVSAVFVCLCRSPWLQMERLRCPGHHHGRNGLWLLSSVPRKFLHDLKHPQGYDLKKKTKDSGFLFYTFPSRAKDLGRGSRLWVIYRLGSAWRERFVYITLSALRHAHELISALFLLIPLFLYGKTQPQCTSFDLNAKGRPC